MLIDQDALQLVREHELAIIADLLPAGGRVLEIGGGAGWQAAALASRGFNVVSVDVEGNPYAGVSVWPVMLYDGVRLPFADASFDAVFSSNVLEHVAHLPELLDDVARVVRPGGRAVHLMPTPTWRVATMLTHYPWLVRSALTRRKAAASPAAVAARKHHGITTLVSRLLIAPRHGESGNVFSEILSFSARVWRGQLQRPGWHLDFDRGAGIAYTGYFIGHPWLTRTARRRLARWIGSGCNVYVLTRAGTPS